ncbi:MULTISPECIES: RHS repeat-associated core domain-containing protein [unclassified Streptomyces]|uniref:RHS repeat-associated core domain-containing protein n=1 Tax=unclassified Streptomyces TaxID=2593676 RepID=UPI0034507081
MKSTTYTFDPLDRTASKTADGKTTDFEYLGLSSEVLDEKVAGELTKSYQYSPWGQRLSQVKHNTDGTTEDGYNSHTDVETLTDDNGDTKATYGYTAYGSNDESEFTGIDKPETTDPTKEDYNPYRYNSKRWDAQSGTYDMGFRDYNPGLNRFTTRDMYNGALADMGLGTDPFTGNRYAFTGGNPVSNVELDGHMPAPMDGGSSTPAPGGCGTPGFIGPCATSSGSTSTKAAAAGTSMHNAAQDIMWLYLVGLAEAVPRRVLAKTEVRISRTETGTHSTCGNSSTRLECRGRTTVLRRLKATERMTWNGI